VPSVEVQATELLEHLTSVDFHFLWLVVQLITLRETIIAWNTIETHHHPKLLGQLGNDIRGQLVELHLKLDQDVRMDRLRHLKPSYEKFIKSNIFIIHWLSNNLLPLALVRHLR
jgi:hypothetical protein